MSVAHDQALRTLIIIPARRASTRFPNKPLALLRAPGGETRPLIEWVWRAARRASGIESVVVATDCPEISACVEGFGGRAMMTASTARNGTERCALVLEQMGGAFDLVVNLQGDSPLSRPEHIAALIAAFAAPDVQVATPYVRCSAAMSEQLRNEHARGRIGGTCVTIDAHDNAVCFSKAPIPARAAQLNLHLGLYAYRPSALTAYSRLPQSASERAEGLEQLRFLEAAVPIRMVEVALPEGGIWEVNNPEDIALVEPLLD